MSAFDWSDERISYLRIMIDGGHTSAVIAEKLGGGVSRSAVCGKASRLGLRFGSGPGGERVTKAAPPPAPPAPAARPAPAAVSKPAPSAPKAAAPVRTNPEKVSNPADGAVPFADLAYDECRWPSGGPDVADFRFCGAPAHGLKPYCRAHCLRAYEGPRDPKLAKRFIAEFAA